MILFLDMFSKPFPPLSVELAIHVWSTGGGKVQAGGKTWARHQWMDSIWMTLSRGEFGWEGENVVREERKSRNWALELSFFVAGFHHRSQMTRCVPCPAAVPTMGLPPPTPSSMQSMPPLASAKGLLSLPRMIWILKMKKENRKGLRTEEITVLCREQPCPHGQYLPRGVLDELSALRLTWTSHI